MESKASPTEDITVTKFSAKRNRWPLAAAVVVAVVFLGGAYYWLANGSSNEANANEVSPAQVEITKEGFNPATIRVKKGQQITWVNKDAQEHQVAAGAGLEALADQTSLGAGDSVTITAERSGTFKYHDKLSDYKLTGILIVDGE